MFSIFINQLIPEDIRVLFFPPLINFNSVNHSDFYFFDSHKIAEQLRSFSLNFDSIGFIMDPLDVLIFPSEKFFVRMTLEKPKQNLYLFSFLFSSLLNAPLH